MRCATAILLYFSNTNQNTQQTQTAPPVNQEEQTTQTSEEEQAQNNQPEQQTTPSQTTQSSEEITSQELATHNSKTDCWVGYKGKVYDVTNFLNKHPGGANAIAKYCGTSSQFEAGFTSQHGAGKVNTLEKEGIYKGEII